MTLPIDPNATLGPAPSVNPYSSAHTLQAFIQLVYLKTANNVLVDSLASLENALGTTNDVLKTLTGIQNMKNLLSVNAKSTFNMKYTTPSFGDILAGTAFSVSSYTQKASAFFGKPVTLSATLGTGSTLAANITSYFTLRNEVKAEMSALLPLTPLVPNGASTIPDPSSLYAKLKAVYQDMTQYVSSTATSTTSGVSTDIKKWILDNYNATKSSDSATAGDIQKRVTDAITAAQSLNTTQAQSVRNYLYIFQEYYKSAGSLLTAINRIISQMANAIKG